MTVTAAAALIRHNPIIQRNLYRLAIVAATGTMRFSRAGYTSGQAVSTHWPVT